MEVPTTGRTLNSIWTRTFTLLAALLLAALLLYKLAGIDAALSLFAGGVLILYLRDKRYLHALWKWVQSDQTSKLPPATGAWELLLAMLYKQHRRNQKQNDALTEALMRFQRAAQALPDGVITLNRDNQILWFNAHAGEHCGLQYSADVGQYITNLLRTPDFLAYLSQSDWETPIVIRLRTDRVQDRILSLQLVGYGDDQKLLLSRDITNIEKLETVRRDFVANVSHELKTPLTVLSGFLETIRELKLPAKQQEHYLSLMSEQAERMERLVSDLLTLSALESNNHPAEEPVNMSALIEQIEQTARQLSAGQHDIRFEIEPGLNLIGAETELTSALTNLVTNAIRYTPADGKVGVSWKLVHVNDELTAQFSVSDSGIGIPAQHIPRLTERFYRVDRGRSRESGGTGLGLAIVKHVMTRHQGRLEIESTVGVGSRFTAIFPSRRVVKNALSSLEQTMPKDQYAA